MSSLIFKNKEKLVLSVAALFLLVACIAYSVSQTAVAAEPDAANQVVVLDVQGMSWEYCSFAVSEALYNLEGVKEAIVDLYYATATVRYDPGIVDIASLLAATDKAGYTSTVQKQSE